MNPEIIDETPLMMAEVRVKMDKEEELTFRAQKTKDYLNENTIINSKKAADAKKAIEELEIPRFKEQYVVKIIDNLPVSVEELKSVLSAYPITVTNDNLKKILDVLDSFR